jgi:hypothetical protein
MKNGNNWLDPSSHHSGYQIIVMRHPLFIYRAIAEGKESWPFQSAKFIPSIFSFQDVGTHQEKDGEKYGTPKFASRAISCLYR